MRGEGREVEVEATATLCAHKTKHPQQQPSPIGTNTRAQHHSHPTTTTAKRDADRLQSTVDDRWRRRLSSGDPVLLGCARAEAARALDEWVDAQVFQQADSKWGNRLSSKFFLEKKFVVKHVLNKHAEKVEAARQDVSSARARLLFFPLCGLFSAGVWGLMRARKTQPNGHTDNNNTRSHHITSHDNRSSTTSAAGGLSRRGRPSWGRRTGPRARRAPPLA